MGVRRWHKRWRAYRKVGRISRSNADLAFAAFLQEQEHRIRSDLSKDDPKSRSNAKRRSREVVRSYLKIARRNRGIKRRPIRIVDALIYKVKPDYLRDTLYRKFAEDWTEISKRLLKKETKIFDVTDLSFSRQPNATLKAISDIIKLSGKCVEIRLNFLDHICDDIAPYIVLAHVRRSLPPIFSGGIITPELTDVIDAVGMRRALRIGHIRKRKNAREYAVAAFRLTSRTPPGSFGDEDYLLRPQTKEYVADEFCDTLNAWLRTQDIELTEEAEGSFVRAIGEALDNAERHGDASSAVPEGDWSIAAFAKLHFVDGKPKLQCSLGIVSVGATISESLNSAAPAVDSRISDYVDQHRKHTSAEALRCVMALQDGITRVGEATKHLRGGVGFMELVDVVAELGANDEEAPASAFTVISGRACIQVTAPFYKGSRNEHGLRELWFNDKNEASTRPSQTHVFTLDTHFPGVILSATFTIDPAFLRKKLEGHPIADGQNRSS